MPLLIFSGGCCVSLFSIPIEQLKGVGEKRGKLFRKIGAPTAGDLLRLYPRAYEDLSMRWPIASAPLNEPCAIPVTILTPPSETRARGGLLLTKLKATDGMDALTLTFFQNPYIKNLLHQEEQYVCYGRVTAHGSKREMLSPECIPAGNCPTIRPVYRQTAGLSSRLIQNAVKNALALLPDVMRDPIPEEYRLRHCLCQLRFALENIHFPRDAESLTIARTRLVFEELLILQLGLLAMKHRRRAENHLPLDDISMEPFTRRLPFTLTGAQKRAIDEAIADMAGTAPMNRLIQGDVGSGKTAVAAALCYAAAKSGMQAALMAPTEILARQHYQSLSALLEPMEIPTALLTGSLRAKEKRQIQTRLQEGAVGLVIGTHALLSEEVVFQRLGLVVTDEQHRFGVAQRGVLAAKGDNPHLLVMSATPIPRTLALMIYGDLDLSVLDELPPGRQTIQTFAIGSKKRERAFAFIQKHVSEGRQAYIICPLIDESGNDMASVTQYADRLQTEWLPQCRIGVLHGKLRPAQKDAVMAQFASAELDVLVSTTVVEVGVDVPNAVIMMIENAERYGLSQLHQLRGRVGRGQYASTCILVSDAQNDEAVRRLEVMCRTANGFEIADEDLRLRGPGDFFGSRQHGLPDLKIANMVTDMEVLRQAQETARELLRLDPDLAKPDYRGLRAQVRQLFSGMKSD